MPLDTLLAELRGLGIRLWVDPAAPDKLRLRAAEGVLTPALREALTQRKAELLALLAPQAETPLVPLPPQASWELSPAQRRLWVLSQFPEGAAAYHIPLHQRLDGPLDRAALERALQRLVARHESLRTTIEVIGGEPRQVVHAALPMRLDFQPMQGSEAAQCEAVRALGQAHVLQPFDLAAGPLLRACLVALGAERHVLLFTIHHIVADGMSLGVLARDLSALYQSEVQGTPHGLPALPFGYPAYAAWQNARQQDAALQAHRRWWHESLAGEIPVLELPADRPRPPQPSWRGAELYFQLPRAPLDALQGLCAARQASLFMGLHALLKVLLARWAGQQDVVVGTVVAGREQPQLLDQVGFYLNTLALRSTVRAETPFEDFLAEVAAQTRQAFDHQSYPFDRLVTELQVRRDPSRSPLFDVMLVLQSQEEPGLALGGLRAQPAFEHPGSSKFDLTFCFKALPGGLALALEYATDLYDAARIRRLGQHFMQLVHAVLAAPRTPLGRLELLTPDERRQLLDGFNRTAAEFPRERTAVELFEAAARAAGGRTALACGGRAMRYAELDEAATRLARRLRRQGAGAGSLVGLHVGRSPELVVGLLGILKAGAAYVPLDPNFPAERLAHIVDDAGVRLLVVHGDAPTLPAAGALQCVQVLAAQDAGDDEVEDAAPRPRAAGPRDLAYVIYTSGSTGRPKGVEIPNRALVNCLTAMARRPGLRQEDVLLSVTTVSFDIATLELLLPLVTGARLVLATEAEATDGPRLAALLRESGATVMQATPATWRMLITAGWGGTPGLKVLCGGEALPGRLGRELRERAAAVWNMYGPTETTIWSTCHELGSEGPQALRDDAAEPIGRPIANTTLFVLDALLQPVPVGVAGDLYIGGEGLAVGYHGKPGLTAERFIDAPLATAAGQRLYRTGDSARWREDGLLEFLGRTDQQVKLRGFRIELGEIEAVLAEHPDIAQAVVDARDDAVGDARLVAWYLRRGGGTAPVAEQALREHVKRRLPAYMVPAQFVALAALPMTPNAKVDRRALQAPQADAGAPQAQHQPPRSAWECRLAGLWQEVLGVARVGLASDFFALGGHSLKAAALAARVQQDSGVALTLVDVFQSPTLAGLAACCEARGHGAALPAARAAGPSPAGGDVLSPAQRRLWVVEQMAQGSGAYNIPAAVRLEGEVDEAALDAALHALVARHESLRTTLRAVDGEPRQFVHEAWCWGEVLERLDCSAEDEAEAAALRVAARHAARPFDLAQGPLLRVALVRAAPRRHLLLFNIHHIVADLASMEVLVRELSQAYEACAAGREPGWAPLPLPLQYRDYAAWQHARLAGPEGARHREYWLRQLAPPLAPLELPADFPRPPLKTWEARVWRIRLSPQLAARVRGCALRHAMTPFMVLTAALGVLLHRCTGAQDVIVGFPLAGRERAELAAQVGFFVNTVALRQTLQATDRFDAVLERARRTLLQAYEHQDYPFDRLVEELQLPRDLSRSPVFDVTVSLLHGEGGALRLGAAEAAPLDSGFAAAKTDLAFEFQDTAGGLELAITYATDLFAEDRIRRMGTHFARLLGAAAARPHTPIGELPLLSPLEAWQLREGFNRSAQPFELDGTVVDLFLRHAAATPGAPAVRFEGRDTGFAELAAEVRRIAALLAAHGVRSGTRVGVHMAPGALLPAAFLGVLAAGGVYVPLDTANPVARLQAMVADAALELVLTQAPLPGALQGCTLLDARAQPPLHAATPAQPGPQAYVIFTSGSSGRPKPTVLTHKGLLNVAHEQARLFGPRQGDRVLQFAALGFDASVFELVLALCHGATLCLAPREALLPGAPLQGTLERERISMALLPPAALAALPEDAALPALRVLTVGGEACPAEVVRRWAPGRAFFNLYGPTEITIFATAARCDAADAGPVTIGGPIANTRVYVLDAQRRPVPLGVPGELCIAGAGVGQGYLGLEQLTAERFVADPFDPAPGARMYRSGDLARWRADGRIEYLGRIDQQVKLRGFRIEPGEIEAVLRTQPQVADAVVLLREDGPQNRCLVGFVTPRDAAAAPEGRALRELVRERLPEYMVPARVVVVPRLPMTPNQKVDRRALLAADEGAAAAQPAFEPPRDDVEHALAGFFAETLKVPASRVGALDDFFELGGDSLLATRIVSRLQATFRSGVSIPQLLRAGHVRALAEAVRASLPPGQADTVAATWRRIQALTPQQRQALIERTAGQKRPATHTTP